MVENEEILKSLPSNEQRNIRSDINIHSISFLHRSAHQ
ncbi:hypothetical protein BofuT4_uP117810.1 [Botrytis cinerea T4]|uniref:Uncharacterized protein n=1 Tax=Botryotinia fuckeliana (strain T4) TaxID=999810 RepID=G2Y0R6_BOTF4|nr:hypothetical protein BofuT4_uP117810.1 [Botrytis cinerea T4]